MNCKELAYLLADYLDGTMDPRMRAELDEHIAGCKACMIFAKTYRLTCRKAAELRGDIQYEIPDEVQEWLVARKRPRTEDGVAVPPGLSLGHEGQARGRVARSPGIRRLILGTDHNANVLYTCSLRLFEHDAQHRLLRAVGVDQGLQGK